MLNLFFISKQNIYYLKNVFLGSFIFLFISCQTFEKKLSENNQLRPPIEDCVTLLTQHYPPALNKIQINKADKPFGKALEEELRAKGYAIIQNSKTEKKKDSIVNIDYLFDKMSPSTFRLRLAVSDKFYTYRLYELIDNQLQPISPLSIEWRE